LVVLRKGASRSPEQICSDANAKLGKSQRLSAVEAREVLPRSSIGKILKKELRIPFWENAKT
jgi:long-chain acyl-CoA synthetase